MSDRTSFEAALALMAGKHAEHADHDTVVMCACEVDALHAAERAAPGPVCGLCGGVNAGNGGCPACG